MQLTKDEELIITNKKPTGMKEYILEADPSLVKLKAE